MLLNMRKKVSLETKILGLVLSLSLFLILLLTTSFSYMDGKIIGIVSVGFLVEDVRAQIFKDLSKEMIVSLVAIMISIIGSYMLARSIRKDTLGLEPFEIANLYKEKNAVLQSVKEGILA